MIRCLWAGALLGLAAGVAAAGNDPTTGITRIDVYPREVSLRAARETLQLVVTGYDVAGTTRDLTHDAEFRSRDATIATVEGRRIMAEGNGRTEVEIRVGDHHQTVAIETTNVDRPDPIRFRSEVLPALTKQGCNAGSCHGSPEGKGRFALSMLAYKPSIDEESLTTGGLAAHRAAGARGKPAVEKAVASRRDHVAVSGCIPRMPPTRCCAIGSRKERGWIGPTRRLAWVSALLPARRAWWSPRFYSTATSRRCAVQRRRDARRDPAGDL